MADVPTFASLELEGPEEVSVVEARDILRAGMYVGLMVEPPSIGDDYFEVPQKVFTTGPQLATGYMRQRYEPASPERGMNWGTAKESWGKIAALGLYETFTAREPTHVVRFHNGRIMSIHKGESAMVKYSDLNAYVGKYAQLMNQQR